MGGSFVTRMAELFQAEPRWFDIFDYLVLGDGEEPLLALVRQGGRPTEPATIPNLCFRVGTEVRQSAIKSRTNLGSLPVPMLEFDGIDLAAYVAPLPVVALPISRGCYWGKCTFCNISNQAEEPYRVRPVDKVVSDIKILQRVLSTSYFDFCVDSYHPSGLSKLSQALIDAELEIRWNAEVLLDPKFTSDCLANMARSGCRHLRFGFESANSNTLEIMRKRNDKVVVDRILHDCCALDIKVSLMSIIGFPTETVEEAWNTVNYYLEHANYISFVTLHRFNVSAGSPIMRNPSLCNIELQRIRGLLQPRYRYVNKNARGMSPDEVKALLPKLEEQIYLRYPQHAEIHTVGIGGWLTFLACCKHDASFFKRPIDLPDQSHLRGVDEKKPKNPKGAYVAFQFDVPTVERIARGEIAFSKICEVPHCVILSEDGRKLFVLPGHFKTELEEIYAG